MPGFLMQVGAQVICPHGGQVSIVPSNMRVKVSGQPVAVLSDTNLVSGCPFAQPSGAPNPCIKVQWTTPALRVKVSGQPALLQDSKGICISALGPQGPPSVLMTQIRVKGV